MKFIGSFFQKVHCSRVGFEAKFCYGKFHVPHKTTKKSIISETYSFHFSS
jgi:hypothetical protein